MSTHDSDAVYSYGDEVDYTCPDFKALFKQSDNSSIIWQPDTSFCQWNKTWSHVTVRHKN